MSAEKSGQPAADAAVSGATHSDDDDSTSQVSDSGEADDEDMVSDAPSSISSVQHSGTVATHFTQHQQHHQSQPQHPAYQCDYPGCGAVSAIACLAVHIGSCARSSLTIASDCTCLSTHQMWSMGYQPQARRQIS